MGRRINIHLSRQFDAKHFQGCWYIKILENHSLSYGCVAFRLAKSAKSLVKCFLEIIPESIEIVADEPKVVAVVADVESWDY